MNTAPPVAPTRGSLPDSVRDVLEFFHRLWTVHVWLWLRTDGEWEVIGTAPPPSREPDPASVELDAGSTVTARILVQAGVQVESTAIDFLVTVIGRLLRQEEEARFLGSELAERYEEITLLYSISEILGSVISLDRAADTILAEVVGTLGVERAALWVYHPEQEHLRLVASVGEPVQRGVIPVDDDASVTANVFRERRALILDSGDEFPRDNTSGSPVRRQSFLSVPISYTPPDGEPRTIGVINLVGRSAGEGFSAGDQKLISAIASQIGAALENSRLIADSLRQERLVREMELAHDLQLKLLPSTEQFAGFAEVAARCVPAESVGGDFYHLLRLPGGRFGAMIGDVSSHGFSAALIMALTMSAVSIHASEDASPAEVLRRAHRALIDELETTEMYLTLFYGVIDPAANKLTYANAGHSHAFAVGRRGKPVRLEATNPPFGLVHLDIYAEKTTSWRSGEDLLLLFTDGLTDSLGLGEIESERVVLETVASHRAHGVDSLLEELFELRVADPIAPADDRTAVLVRV